MTRASLIARPLGLLVALFAARCFVLADRSLDFDLWTPFALLWPDVAVCFVYALIDFSLSRKSERIAWAAFGLLVAYVAINVPVARILSSPMSWTMLRAARGTLGDSILHYMTLLNLGLIAGTGLIGVFGAIGLRRVSGRKTIGATCAALLLVGTIGFLVAPLTETLGHHRNALSILFTTAFSRVPAAASTSGGTDWRRSPIPSSTASSAGVDLADLRGRARGRNVVVIVLESTGAEYLAPYGGAEDPMPHLGELFGESIVFDRAYTTYPESIKSLIAVLCSRFPALDTSAEDHGRVTTPSLAKILGAQGYRTGLFHSGRFLYLGMDAVLADRGFDVLEDAGDIGGERESSFGVEEKASVARILEWVDGLERDEPFFVAYLPVAGHHPYDTPERGPFPDETERGRYLNALRYADASVHDLIEGLKSRGHHDDTLFVVFGDHGEAFDQHDGNFGHSLYIFEENVRVPLAIALPGLVASERRVASLASVVDLTPTILDLLGLPAPLDFDGHSLLDGEPRVALFFADYSQAFLGMRDDRWKYILDLETGRGQLYDLEVDPREKSNVAEDHPGRAAAYREHVKGWAAETKGRVTREGY